MITVAQLVHLRLLASAARDADAALDEARAIGEPEDFMAPVYVAADAAHTALFQVLDPAVVLALLAMIERHDTRVTELLEANNREVERRRAAERTGMERAAKHLQNWPVEDERAMADECAAAIRAVAAGAEALPHG